MLVMFSGACVVGFEHAARITANTMMASLANCFIFPFNIGVMVVLTFAVIWPTGAPFADAAALK